MIIEYEMRYIPRFDEEKWVEFCGKFKNWDAFKWFEKTQRGYYREIRNAKEINYGIRN